MIKISSEDSLIEIEDDVVLKSCILYCCSLLGGGGGGVEKWILKLTLTEVEVEAELGKKCMLNTGAPLVDLPKE